MSIVHPDGENIFESHSVEYRLTRDQLIQKAFFLADIDKPSQKLIELRVCGDWSYRQIAHELGYSSHTTVVKKLHRIEKKMKLFIKSVTRAMRDFTISERT